MKRYTISTDKNNRLCVSGPDGFSCEYRFTAGGEKNIGEVQSDNSDIALFIVATLRRAVSSLPATNDEKEDILDFFFNNEFTVDNEQQARSLAAQHLEMYREMMAEDEEIEEAMALDIP